MIRNSFFVLVMFFFGCTNENEDVTPEIEHVNSVVSPYGNYPVEANAQAIDVTSPDHIIGDGTPESCDCDAVVDAIKLGGKIVFNCGGKPLKILMNKPIQIINDKNNKDVVIDGGGLITLNGDGDTRLLYMNTCDQSLTWSTNHCNNQDHPRLTVQNLTFANGNSSSIQASNGGGGAIWVRGGRFKAVNCNFFNNICASTGADLGGGAIRVTSQYNHLPIYITNCTFGGIGLGNKGANGGALSSINESWTVTNSFFYYNEALGDGGNPAASGTLGGGSGGAIYNDGKTMTLKLLGSKIEYNKVNSYGSSIFFVSNDKTGNIIIKDCLIENNTGGSWYPKYPSISAHKETPISVTNSIIK